MCLRVFGRGGVILFYPGAKNERAYQGDDEYIVLQHRVYIPSCTAIQVPTDLVLLQLSLGELTAALPHDVRTRVQLCLCLPSCDVGPL